MKFTIDRSKWLRGEGSINSYLLRESDGKMCCLGFFGLACGLEPERIYDIDSPSTVPVTNGEAAATLWENKNGVAHFLFDEDNDSSDCQSLMEINDKKETDREAREEMITDIFAKHGVEVEFIGE